MFLYRKAPPRVCMWQRTGLKHRHVLGRGRALGGRACLRFRFVFSKRLRSAWIAAAPRRVQSHSSGHLPLRPHKEVREGERFCAGASDVREQGGGLGWGGGFMGPREGLRESEGTLGWGQPGTAPWQACPVPGGSLAALYLGLDLAEQVWPLCLFFFFF